MKNAFWGSILLIIATLLASPTAYTQPEMGSRDNKLTNTELKAGWKLLFDGKTPSGWRGYNKKSFPDGWTIENGTLKSLGTASDAHGGDLVYGAESYGEFELMIDWKISPGGNSGIMYHVMEGSQYPAPYYTGPEYQLIDDIGFPEKLEEWQKAGCDYAMYTAPAKKKLKAAGKWNRTRILFTKNKVEYWLNGKKTVSFVPWSDDWNKRRQEGKWADFPDYGKATSGLIALQDHGSFIWFKNIKIRKL